MSLTDKLGPDSDLDPPNEELLNVIRRSDKRGVGTSEIVKAVDMGSDGVRHRLRGLEAEGRVESETIGSENDYSFVWYLSKEERRKPVNPDIARLVKWCERMKSLGQGISEAAKLVGLAGTVIVILTLSALVEGISLGGFNSTLLLYAGWATVIGAAGAGAIGGGLIYISIIAEWGGERIVNTEN